MAGDAEVGHQQEPTIGAWLEG